VVNMGIGLYDKVWGHIKKIGQDRMFKKRTEILSVTTCILFSGCICVILIACGMYEYVSLICLN